MTQRCACPGSIRMEVCAAGSLDSLMIRRFLTILLPNRDIEKFPELTQLPESFGNLPPFTGMLKITGNENLTSLPNSFGNLKIGTNPGLGEMHLCSL